MVDDGPGIIAADIIFDRVNGLILYAQGGLRPRNHRWGKIVAGEAGRDGKDLAYLHRKMNKYVHITHYVTSVITADTSPDATDTNLLLISPICGTSLAETVVLKRL